MTDCLNGTKYIRWRYEGEDWNQIKADDYELENEVAQCPVPYKLTTRWRSDRKPEWRYYVNASEDYQPPFTNMMLGKNNGRSEHEIEGFPSLVAYRAASRYSWRWESKLDFNCFDRDGNPRFFRVVSGSRDSSGQNEYIEFVGFERIDGLPDDCGECKLTIFKNEAIVYERTEKSCPEVKEYCDIQKCPPGTCECRHGSVVCCHDSKTGEVVKQFRLYK